MRVLFLTNAQFGYIHIAAFTPAPTGAPLDTTILAMPRQTPRATPRHRTALHERLARLKARPEEGSTW
jgi:hypothetical protein